MGAKYRKLCEKKAWMQFSFNFITKKYKLDLFNIQLIVCASSNRIIWQKKKRTSEKKNLLVPHVLNM